MFPNKSLRFERANRIEFKSKIRSPHSHPFIQRQRPNRRLKDLKRCGNELTREVIPSDSLREDSAIKLIIISIRGRIKFKK